MTAFPRFIFVLDKRDSPRSVQDAFRKAKKIYLHYDIKVGSSYKKGFWSLGCVAVCGLPLKRFHLTCFWCWTRRIYYGLMKNDVEVQVTVIPLPKTIRYGTMRFWALKTLLSLAEFVAKV